MNRGLANLIAMFVRNKEKRKELRKKLLKNSHMTILKELRELNKQLNERIDIIERTIDISKAIPAKGTLRDIQLLSLEMLKCIDKICKKHNITYWLDFGTLLGAVRHKGFIPWDDDIDICMHIDDFNKFCKIIDDEFKNTPFQFKKAPSHLGKCIYRDFAPQTEKQWIEFLTWQQKEKLTFAIDVFPYYPSNKSITEIQHTILDGIATKRQLLLKTNNYKDLDVIGEHIQETHSKLIDKNGERLFLGIECIAGQPRVLEKEDLFPLKTIDFEGIEFPAPAHCHRVLTKEYGNYWEFPKTKYSHLSIEDLDETEIEKLEKLIKHI